MSACLRVCVHDAPLVILTAAADLDAHNALCREAAIDKFNSIATMGPADDIAKYRDSLVEEMDEMFQEYIENNAARDPFQNLEYYALPLAVGGSSYFATIVISIFCFQPKTTEWCVRVTGHGSPVTHAAKREGGGVQAI